jgi:hypothetical protein
MTARKELKMLVLRWLEITNTMADIDNKEEYVCSKFMTLGTSLKDMEYIRKVIKHEENNRVNR